MSDQDIKKGLLQQVLDWLRQTGAYPETQAFRIANEAGRRVIDEMVDEGLLVADGGRYFY